MKKINILRWLCVVNVLWEGYLGRFSDIPFNDMESLALFIIMTISLANLQLTFTMRELYE